jgi:hypothetical protein
MDNRRLSPPSGVGGLKQFKRRDAETQRFFLCVSVSLRLNL